MELDRISNVPADVVDRILLYLPLKDAVKTSVLSTKWRNRWATLPSLVFDDQSFPPPLNSEGVALVNKLVSGIDRILLLHSGAIDSFKLSYAYNIPDDDIDKWILHLSRRSIKELVCVRVGRWNRYRMPSYLFSCRNLIHLELSGCDLRPPSSFKGFKELKSLDLNYVKLSRNALESLISSAPLLERLTLHSCFGPVNIDAPNLQYIELDRVFNEINIKNASRLAEFSMKIVMCNINRNLMILWENMPRICRLALEHYSLIFLANGFIPQELPAPFVYLQTLIIGIDLNSFKETATLLCLLRSAPNLQQLEIKSCLDQNSGTSGEFWEAGQWNRPFSCLRYVQIVISGKKAEMDFINFMLLSSPALQRMTVKLSGDGNTVECDRQKLEVAKQLLDFSRASTQAKIVLLES